MGEGIFSIQTASDAFLFLTLARFAGEGRGEGLGEREIMKLLVVIYSESGLDSSPVAVLSILSSATSVLP
jgi:hypothetical protein